MLTASFIYRIPARPSSHAWTVPSVAPVAQQGSIVEPFGAKAEGIGFSQSAGSDNGATKGIVFIMGGDGAVVGDGYELADISVSVVGVKSGCVIKNGIEKAADAACALEGAGEVNSPDVEVG